MKCRNFREVVALRIIHRAFIFLLITVSPTGFAIGQSPWCGAYVETTQQKKEDLKYEHIEFREVAIIPVVVHVVWKDQVDSIAETQILSQITALNRDFRLQNENQSIVPTVHERFKADMEIEFCLASIDPSGNATNGITYTKTAIEQIGNTNAVFYTERGGKDAWNTDAYLNVWVCQMEVAGKASFPEQSLPEEDGIRIRPNRFGTTGTVEEPYHLGRTAVHEIGHFLNLFHLWGGQDCDALMITTPLACCSNIDPTCPCDDLVDDTPPTIDTYFGTCFENPNRKCGETGMHVNYMTFSDDACMAMFTNGQKQRAWTTLNGSRRGLLSSNGCEDSIVNIDETLFHDRLIQIYPNPVSENLLIRNNTSGTLKLRILTIDGKLLSSYSSISTLVEIDVANYHPGIYLLKFQSKENIFTKKLIID